MKAMYAIIVVVIGLFILSGCKNAGIVVDNTTDTQDNEKVTENTEGIDNKELIKKLTEEAGLPTEEEEELEDAEETVVEEVSEANTSASDSAMTVTIVNFHGVPEDFTIKVGDKVTWVNEQKNMLHIIGVRKWEGSKYSNVIIDGYNSIVPGESYSYIFNESGKYEWLSKTKYPDVSGEIRVIEIE